MINPIKLVSEWNDMQDRMELSPETFEFITLPAVADEDPDYMSDYLPRAEGCKVVVCINRDHALTGDVVLIQNEKGFYEAGRFGMNGGANGMVPTVLINPDVFIPLETSKVLGKIEFIRVEFK